MHKPADGVALRKEIPSSGRPIGGRQVHQGRKVGLRVARDLANPWHSFRCRRVLAITTIEASGATLTTGPGWPLLALRARWTRRAFGTRLAVDAVYAVDGREQISRETVGAVE
jgi:hypothetical protein